MALNYLFMSSDQANYLLAVLTLLGQILALCFTVYLLFFRKSQARLINFFTKNAISLAFFVSLAAVSGSLYYSQIVGLTPCELCWFQRIFMYPQPILLGLAWLKKDKGIINYSLALVSVGALISLYHNYIYYTAPPVTFCSIITPCTQPYVIGFNYLSLPLMALTAFVMIGLLLLNKKIRLN